jgi:uncharacterized protein YjbI with pentapeptide repeats
MANPEHLQLLKQGVEAWNAWRRQNLDIKPDLHRANLDEANLDEANLHRANLHRANLIGARLGAANLHRANLSGANLIGARLGAANLHGANLEYRKIKRPFPPTARAHPVAHPAPPGTTTRRASTREAAWAWQAVRKLATKSCELRPRRLVQTSGTVRYRLAR